MMNRDAGIKAAINLQVVLIALKVRHTNDRTQ
jgi:hypothetical protein